MTSSTRADAPPEPAPAPRKPIVITSPRRFSLPSLAHLWEAREVLTRFGARDVTLRYRQTALGVTWVVLQPLLTAGVFTLVFGRVAKLSSGGVPYFAFSFAGMLCWNVFSGTISRASAALVGNAALVSKVYFPRLLVPLSSVCSLLVDFAVSMVIMVILLGAYQINPGWAVLLLPVWLLLTVLLASGIGVVCSALMVKYRDVQYVVPFALQFVLYASPIAYALSNVPRSYRFIYDANPISWLLQAFRWSLLRQPAPAAWQFVGLAVVPVVVFAAGVLVFEQMERGFADVI